MMAAFLPLTLSPSPRLYEIMRSSTALYISLVFGISLMACTPDDEHAAPAAAGRIEQPRIHFNQDDGTVDVEGLEAGVLRRLREAALATEDWAAFFAVYTADSTLADPAQPPVMGAYSVEPSAIRFTPRFPFVAGLSYRVRIEGAVLHAKALPRETIFTVRPRAASAPTVVTEVYPTTDSLPMNQLKFYLHFSAPMQTGRAYAHLQLIDHQTETPVEAPFVEMDPELWDPEQRRFTLSAI